MLDSIAEAAISSRRSKPPPAQDAEKRREGNPMSWTDCWRAIFPGPAKQLTAKQQDTAKEIYDRVLYRVHNKKEYTKINSLVNK
jgi:hypothetical protein